MEGKSGIIRVGAKSPKVVRASAARDKQGSSQQSMVSRLRSIVPVNRPRFVWTRGLAKVQNATPRVHEPLPPSLFTQITEPHSPKATHRHRRMGARLWKAGG